MQPDEFLSPHILIVSGKGGVGKTTVAAALALVAARQGRKVCVAEVDGKGTLNKLFDAGPLTYEPHEMSTGVWGMNIIPEEALAEYMTVQYHMRGISRIFRSTHFVDYITTAAPGLKDILVLGKVWYLETNKGATNHYFDTIIVDAPAAGHMLTFLSAPMGLADAVRLGPVARQSDWLIQMLRDPKRSRVHMVTLAEEMPVSETLETAAALEAKLRIDTGATFVNALYEELLTDKEARMLEEITSNGNAGELAEVAGSAGLSLDGEDVDALIGYERFLKARRSIQAQHLEQLRANVSEPIIELPFLFSAGLALPDIETLADAIEAKVEEL